MSENHVELHVKMYYYNRLDDLTSIGKEFYKFICLDFCGYGYKTFYPIFREFELRLPRNEVEEVDHLRERWLELMDLAETVRENLLKERRGAFEQELDKNVKVRSYLPVDLKISKFAHELLSLSSLVYLLAFARSTTVPLRG